MTLTHDAANRVTSVTDSIGDVARYSYDAKGRLATVTDPSGRTTRYKYDDRDLVLTIVKPDGTVWLENTFDAARRLISDRIYGKKTSYRYYIDKDGHVSATEIFGYDGSIGRLNYDSNGLVVAYTVERKGLAPPASLHDQNRT